MTFKRFKPDSEAATKRIDELVARGGRIIKDSAGAVEVRRMDSIATIDAMGRVEWRSAK